MKKENSFLKLSTLALARRRARTHRLCALLLVVIALSQAFSCTFYNGCVIQQSPDFDRSFFSRKVTLRSEARLLIESFTNSSIDREGNIYLRHPQNTNNKQIPKIIHQTYGSQALSSKLRYFVQSWRELNPGWEIRFYDDEACLNFVKQHFPEYLKAYVSLPKSVERSDFFRYMIIYKYGGVYTDIDTECKTPLDDTLLPTDTMVVGWEYEDVSQEDALRKHYVRANQVLQWTFMAAPGHPALREVCDFIKNHALEKFSDNTNRDTLEKTGPGIFTDVVLRHSSSHPPFSANNEELWPVRFLPWVALGSHPLNKEGVRSDSSDVRVLHHFMGGWKSHFVCWSKCKGKFLRRRTRGAGFTHDLHETSSLKSELYLDSIERKLFPVSANFKPAFEIFVYRKGKEIFPGQQDVSDALFKYGRWQEGLNPAEKPSVVDALVGSLGGKKRSVKLLDIGAGIGFFSLAAAARGHDVESFEVSQMALAAFEKSRERNGFEDFIKIHKVALGNDTSSRNFSISHDMSAGTVQSIRHGYPFETEVSKLSSAGGNLSEEAVTVNYKRLEDVISLNKTVGAVRISANGWEGAIIEGGLKLFGHKTNYPSIVLVEMNYKSSLEAGQPNPEQVLFKLYELGYVKISHAGPICRRRWRTQARGLLYPRGKPSTWCSLNPEDFSTFLEVKNELEGENVLFYKPRDWSVDKQLLHDPSSIQQEYEAEPFI